MNTIIVARLHCRSRLFFALFKKHFHFYMYSLDKRCRKSSILF